jgi:hypothetical protein
MIFRRPVGLFGQTDEQSWSESNYWVFSDREKQQIWYDKQWLFIAFLAQLYYAELYVSWNTGINCCSRPGGFPLLQARKRTERKVIGRNLNNCRVYNEKRKNAHISFDMSVCPHVTTREPLNVFSWNMIPRIFTKIFRDFQIFVKIRQR